jgi:hypothetical protein
MHGAGLGIDARPSNATRRARGSCHSRSGGGSSRPTGS